MKKTFIFYQDWIDYTTEMNLEEKGLFFQTILRYHNGEDIGEIWSIKFIWSKVKKQIDEDKEKWESECKKRQEAGREWGKRSGEARRSKTKQNEALASKTPKNEANEADNENENDIIIKDTTIVVSKKHEIKENSFEEAEIFFDKLKIEIKENTGIEPELIKFYNYWTAPMKSGTIYWRSQKTFAFRARLRNWLDKTNKKPNTNFINNKPARWTVW